MVLAPSGHNSGKIGRETSIRKHLKAKNLSRSYNNTKQTNTHNQRWKYSTFSLRLHFLRLLPRRHSNWKPSRMQVSLNYRTELKHWGSKVKETLPSHLPTLPPSQKLSPRLRRVLRQTLPLSKLTLTLPLPLSKLTLTLSLTFKTTPTAWRQVVQVCASRTKIRSPVNIAVNGQAPH